MILFFSDGYPDQFGGPNSLKFEHKKIRNIFLENQYTPMADLEGIYKTTFDKWQGNTRQIDDILVMGIKV